MTDNEPGLRPDREQDPSDANPYRILGQESEASEDSVAEDMASEERARILALGQEALDEKDKTRSHELFRQLRDEGPQAARVFLEQVQAGIGHEGLTMMLANMAATSANNNDLGKVIEAHSNWTILPILPDMAERIATPNLIPYLQRSIKSASYDSHGAPEYDARIRLSYSMKIGMAAEQRGPDDEREQWRQAIEEWLHVYNPTARTPITDQYRNSLRAERHPDILAFKYASNFFDRDDDADFGPVDRNENSRPLAEGASERAVTVENLFALSEERLGERSGGRQRVLEIMAYRENHTSPLAVTLGIEVEILKETLRRHGLTGPESAQDSRDETMYDKLRNYHRTKRLGVPVGKDHEWEFAEEPVRDYLTLSREVQALMHADLINPEHTNHPLHITIGHVTSEGPAGNHIYSLIRGLEATGWSTDGERIRQPTRVPNNWMVYGQSGIREREADKISLEATTAVELRTFELRSLAGLNRTLRAVYALGAGLRAYQQSATNPDEPLDADGQELAVIWQEYARSTDELFAEHGFSRPTAGAWPTVQDKDGNGNDRFIIGPDFENLGHLLDAAEADPNSMAAGIQRTMQNLVTDMGNRAMTVLNRSRRDNRPAEVPTN